VIKHQQSSLTKPVAVSTLNRPWDSKTQWG